MDDEESSYCWKRFPEALKGAVEIAAQAFVLAPQCESPIEVLLGAEIAARGGDGLEVIPQFRLGRYRYDFAIRRKSHPKFVLLIECDGKAFHSTPKQKANDYRKNIAAWQAGLDLLRFTGSEIHKDTRNCALMAITRLRSMRLLAGE